MAAVLAALVVTVPPATAETLVPKGFAPASTSWTGPDTGYVLGYAPCAKSWCPTLLGTTDGGAHWRRLGAPSMALPDNHNHVALTFVSDRVAYVSDGVHLQGTRDGGRTWRRIGLVGAKEPFYLSKIAEIGGRVFAMVTSPREGVTRLYAGKAGASSLLAKPGFSVKGGITYGDLAVGGGLQVTLGADYQTEKYWTSKDGAQFVAASLPCPVDTYARLAGVREKQVVALCNSSPGTPHPGATERHLRHAPKLGGKFSGTDEAPADGITQGFDAASPLIAAVAAEAGGASLLHATSDGGRTWTTTVLSERGFSLDDLDFPGRGTGVVVDGQPDASGGSAVYRTTDGGKSWRELVFG